MPEKYTIEKEEEIKQEISTNEEKNQSLEANKNQEKRKGKERIWKIGEREKKKKKIIKRILTGNLKKR